MNLYWVSPRLISVRKARIASMVAILVSGALPQHSNGTTVASQFTEGPFVGGVFDRPPMENADLVVYRKQVQETTRRPRKAFEVGKYLSDENGNSNELIVLPDSANPAWLSSLNIGLSGSVRAEDVLVEGVEKADMRLLSAFFNPVDARYLIDDDRLDNVSRAELKADDPTERLQRYVILRYGDIASAKKAKLELQKRFASSVGMNRTLRFAWSPNDSYFAKYNATHPAQYQWGLHAMNFPAAWDKALGFSYVADIDTGFVNDTAPADLQKNYRSHFSAAISLPPAGFEAHGTHVGGIIAATVNNSIGVAGACPNCSLGEMRINQDWASIVVGLNKSIERGFQVVNMSLGTVEYSENIACPASNYFDIDNFCTALSLATSRDLLAVASAGNFRWNKPAFPASESAVLAVGGVQIAAAPSNPFSYPYSVQLWTEPNALDWYGRPDSSGSNYPGSDGVMAPAADIVSTLPVGSNYISVTDRRPCADSAGFDFSGAANDGYGNCSGTSMSAPYVSALSGILRSINPRLSASQIKTLIRQASGTFSGTYTYTLSSPQILSSYGVPNALTAVANTIAQTTNRLTPLFSMYSPGRSDYFYTTVPQMAASATIGTLEPRNNGMPSSISYSVLDGVGINGYSSFPGVSGSPKAQVWVFTTSLNPKNGGDPLVPLYRLSWKCGDATISPPVICNSNPQHIDVTYTADSAGVTAFTDLGYKVDGIEGYIYPKTSSQPTGTVKLMRKYNPSRDDHAIFPDTLETAMYSLGYTDNSGSDWLGYVYLNQGPVPSIL
ncbi:MAG: S8 family serine peptidase [Proteobacteria bacterium]|uniref:S8 family serine peptidase n=1 Tax=Rudaea sp. TaxID=2136325 RepID=UPI003783468A|nr:S8 family serine peptidase [Pseudomonadota bacterium]